MVSSPHFHVSLDEVLTKWTLTNLADAHDTLDLLEEAQNRPQK